ncbi:Kinesin-like protein KIF16B [Lamellibrachia satsuma]|nr:Kinesin-like protein KIF16B [Lamellibrachia satsuma]
MARRALTPTLGLYYLLKSFLTPRNVFLLSQIFQDLGTDALQAAFDGYNACIFAYGQTGTGKTHTMMGHPGEIGLIPRICEGLFSRMEEVAEEEEEKEEEETVSFKLSVSYLEIYNERVRDLLHPSLPTGGSRYSLKVREHPKDGPYVQDLSQHIVKDFQSIQALMDKGNKHRTTAVTHMHDKSSRSHAIFTLSFTQARLNVDLPSEIVSKINLVDLAGSERADPIARCDKSRLKEGANINKSLVTLGIVIQALGKYLVTLGIVIQALGKSLVTLDIVFQALGKSLVTLVIVTQALLKSLVTLGTVMQALDKSLVTLGLPPRSWQHHSVLIDSCFRHERCRTRPSRQLNNSLSLHALMSVAERSLLNWEAAESIESGHFSQSNSSMGSCSLPSSPTRRQRHVFIPYRDSVLTWLLKDSLGGNAKTIMIATISPSSLYYSETVSTLRYANRAKNIINRPVINEDTNVKLIRELRAEIVRLQTMLSEHWAGSVMSLSETSSCLAERLEESESRAKELTRSWFDKWQETQEIMKDSDMRIHPLQLSRHSSSLGVIVDSHLPHLICMDDDILSTGVVMYYLQEGSTYIGTSDAVTSQDIVLKGDDIRPEHCVIKYINDEVTLHVRPDAVAMVNDRQVTQPVRLIQGDIIMLGKYMFRFNNPAEAARLREHRKLLYGHSRLPGALSRCSSLMFAICVTVALLYGDSRLPGALSRCSSMSSINTSTSGIDTESPPVSPLHSALCMELEHTCRSETEKLEWAR